MFFCIQVTSRGTPRRLGARETDLWWESNNDSQLCRSGKTLNIIILITLWRTFITVISLLSFHYLKRLPKAIRIDYWQCKVKCEQIRKVNLYFFLNVSVLQNKRTAIHYCLEAKPPPMDLLNILLEKQTPLDIFDTVSKFWFLFQNTPPTNHKDNPFFIEHCI